MQEQTAHTAGTGGHGGGGEVLLVVWLLPRPPNFMILPKIKRESRKCGGGAKWVEIYKNALRRHWNDAAR